MGKWLIILATLIISCEPIRSQPGRFNLVFGYGPSYFFNAQELNRHIDHSWMFGFNYLLNRKRQAVTVNPGLSIRVNDYHALIEKHRIAHVNQRALQLTLDVLLKLSKKIHLRTGLFFNSLFDNVIIITDKQTNNRYYSYSNRELFKTYDPKQFQAGITAGLCLPFILFHREQRFNVTLNHQASALVHSDYKLSKDQVGKDITVLSTRARATMLLFVLELSLQKRSDKKKAEEE